MTNTEPDAEPILFFGEPWGAFATQPEQARRVDTPVGQACLTCTRTVVEGDRGFIRTVIRNVDTLDAYEVAPIHAECEALGLVGHTFGVCTCTGYDTTSREAALELWSRLDAIALGRARRPES
jgi:hypothetical protein